MIETKEKEYQGQKFYDPVRPFRKHRNHNILSRMSKAILKLFTKQPRIIYSEPIVDEPVLYLSNHATRYSPTMMYVYMPRNKRLWTLSSLLYTKTFSNHMMFYWYPNVRGIMRIIYRIMTSFLSLIGPYVYRSMESIPVYRMSTRLKETYEKSIETLLEGKDIAIFPESREVSTEYKYTNNFQNGFYRFAETYYVKTGKCILTYPVYCCRELNTVLVGKPYQYNPKINMKEQSLIVIKYIQDSIEELAKSLPPHKIEPYHNQIKDMEYLNNKYKGIF